jgi:hypothetical protein
MDQFNSHVLEHFATQIHTAALREASRQRFARQAYEHVARPPSGTVRHVTHLVDTVRAWFTRLVPALPNGA